MSNAKLKVVLTAVLLLFAIVPALIVGAAGTFSIMGYEKDAKENTVKTISLSKSAAVDQLFEGYISDINTLSKLDAVVEAASSKDGSADDIIKAYSSGTDIIDTLIIDANGTIIASASGKTGSTFQNFNAENMPAVSALLSWENYDQSDAFFVSKEIYAQPDTRTGGKLGYVCSVISVAPESGIVKALAGTFLENSAYFMLADNLGNALNVNGSGAVARSGSFDSALATEVHRVFSETNTVSASNTSETAYSNKSGKYVYTGGIIPNVTTWRWVGVADAAEFATFSTTTNIIGWGVVVVSCGLACLLALGITTKFLGSMTSMLKTLDAIGAEEGSTIRFDVKSRNTELGEIQASFNELLDEVYLSEERHRTIAELSDNMLFEWDFHKESMYVSSNTLAKFDIDPSQATLSNGRFLDSLMDQENSDRYKRDISMLLKNKNGYSAEYQLRAKSGAVIWVSLRANCITDRLGEPLRVIGVMTDIDNEKKLELQLSERASYDFLSKLYNRSSFIREFTSEIERRGQNKVAAMFLDVDDFKFINDRFGHTVGDEVIRFVADNIRKKVDDRGGFAGRFGGDEFVMCFTNQEDIENIEDIAMNIIDELNMGYTTGDGMLINVKISIGITYCPEHSEDPNELLSFADTAMYFVKKNGKMNYHVYMPEDSESGEYNDPESVF